MVDHWGIYEGKTREELNPWGLKWGDLVVAPDGSVGRLDRPGFKWGFLEGIDRPYALAELRPVSTAASSTPQFSKPEFSEPQFRLAV